MNKSPLSLCLDIMERDYLPQPVIQNFKRLYQLVELGKTGIISEDEIEAVTGLPSYEEISKRAQGKNFHQALEQLVVCKLNGGLGTGMGLERAKSLLEVKDNLTFNDLIVLQLGRLSKKIGCPIPLINLTSFATDEDITAFMTRHGELQLPGIPYTFKQHRHPKIYSDTLMPATDANEALNWNPPGHGDIYPALAATGTLDKLLKAGRRYLFISNSDNVGAVPDPSILIYMIENEIPFLMETAVRTKADRKGGHLAVRRSDGRLVLREAAQAPKDPSGDPIEAFQDTDRYRYFNTNNIWIDLLALHRELQARDGILPLPLIRNDKTIDPRDPSSRKVYQIESAMGAAIELFEGAGAIVVPLERFFPVKSTSDLLVMRSDAVILTESYEVRLNPGRPSSTRPAITLDKRFYTKIDDFEERFRVPPSLQRCSALKVEGNLLFSHPVSIEGEVTIADARPDPKSAPVPLPTALESLRDQRVTV